MEEADNTQYKAIIYKRGDLHYVPSVVGPGDGGGGFEFYLRLMIKEHAGDKSTGAGKDGTSSANARDEQMIIMPKSKTRILGPCTWKNLIKKVKENCIDRVKENCKSDGVDALLIVQTLPSSENTDANHLDNIKEFADVVKECKIKLTVLAVGDSYEVADFCSMEHSVLGWINNLVDSSQVNVAFKFCYNVIDQYFKNLDQFYKSLDAQTPQSTSIRSARTCATRAYLTVLGDFSFLMNGSTHAYKFGMQQAGEPCLFPDCPARPYVDWSVDMYEGRLRNAARRCMETFKELVEHCDSRGCDPIPQKLRDEIMYRIGVYLGWFVLIRHNPKHNLLSRKDDVYELEFSFTGELKPSRAKKEFQRLADEFHLRGIKDYVKFIENQTVDEDIFQLFKLEMIAIGESMLKGTQSLARSQAFVISRAMFFGYMANNKLPASDARFRRKHFEKLDSELEKYPGKDPERTRNAYRQRFIWMHNAFKAMHCGLLYPDEADADRDTCKSCGQSTKRDPPRSKGLQAYWKRLNEWAGKNLFASGLASTLRRFFVASFEIFPYVAVSGLLINDAQKGLSGQDSRIAILAATLSVVSCIGALIVTNNADVKRAKRT